MSRTVTFEVFENALNITCEVMGQKPTEVLLEAGVPSSTYHTAKKTNAAMYRAYQLAVVCLGLKAGSKAPDAKLLVTVSPDGAVKATPVKDSRSGEFNGQKYIMIPVA